MISLYDPQQNRILGETRRLISSNKNSTKLQNADYHSSKTFLVSFFVVANITSKLKSPVNAPINDVNNITRLVQQFNSTRPNLESRLSSIQSKLDALKQRLARVRYLPHVLVCILDSLAVKT